MDPTFLLSNEAFARRIALGLLLDREAAEDLVQEAWLTVLERPPKHASRPRNYIARVLQRLVFHRRRSEKRRATRERAAARDEALDETSALVARAEIHQRTVAAVLALDEPYRSTVLLRFFEDLTPERIGARQRVPVETVRTRLKRALAMLRARLECEGRDWRAEWSVALTSGSSRVHELARAPRAVVPRWGVAALAGATVLVVWSVRSGFRVERGTAAPSADGFAASAPGEAVGLVPSNAPGREVLESVAAPAAPAPRMSGRVTDDAGRPLSGARVLLALECFDYAPAVAEVETDEAGRFSCSLSAWSALSPAQRGLLGLLVEVRAKGHSPLEQSLELSPDGLPGELALVLTPGRALTGRVLDSAGQPVEQAHVNLCARGSEPKTAERRTWVQTDREGWFAAGLEQGERVTEVLLSHPLHGYAYLDGHALPASISGDIELEPVALQPGHALRGRCLYPDGAPVRELDLGTRLVESTPGSGLRPVATGPRSDLALGRAQIQTHTDELGRFEIVGLRAGLYQLVSGGSPLADGAAWSTDGAEIEVVFRGHRVTTEVAGPDRRLLEEARVAVTRLLHTGEPAGAHQRAATSSGLRMVTTVVEPGETLAVLAVVPGCASVEERVEVPEVPYETPVRIQLVPVERRATLLLRPSAGANNEWSVDLCAPLSGVPLPGLQDLVPSEDGRIRALPIGSYRVRIGARSELERTDVLPDYCPANPWEAVTLVDGEAALGFPVLPAARLRILFTRTGTSPSTFTPLRASDFESRGAGDDRWDWMAAKLTSSRGSLELWSPGDTTQPLRRLIGLRPRADQQLDLVAPAGPLRVRMSLDGRAPIEHEVAPAAGETLVISVPLDNEQPAR